VLIFVPYRGTATSLASNKRGRIGSLKVNLSSKKSFGLTPNGFVFQAAFGAIGKGEATVWCSRGRRQNACAGKYLPRLKAA